MGIARNVHWYDENYIPPDRVLDSGTRQKKLNWDIVHEIRDIALTKTKTSRDIWKYICSKYKIEICEQMVSDIIRNKYWRE